MHSTASRLPKEDAKGTIRDVHAGDNPPTLLFGSEVHRESSVPEAEGKTISTVEADRPSPPPVPIPTTPKADPWDLSRLRISQDFASSTPVRKLLTTIPVRKPSKEWFVRTHHEYRLTTVVLELKEDQEIYLVDPDLRSELELESTYSPRLLALAVNRQGVVFLWPIRLPDPDGKTNAWNQSALDACNMAQKDWVRVSANMSLGAYDVALATAHNVEPNWPQMPFGEMIKLGFRDKMISQLDHPVLRRLRGEI